MRQIAASHLSPLNGFLLAISLATSASANDSEGADITTGGLEFLRNEYIRIASEDLFVSPDLIRVEYTYENTHYEDIQIQVAFPIKVVSGWGQELSVEEVVRQLEFKTWVNGDPIDWFPYLGANVENEALCRDLWLTRNQIFDEYGFCFSTLSGRMVFDNSDCTSGTVSLSQIDEERVSAIRASELQNSCSAEPVVQDVNPVQSTGQVNAEDYVSIMRTQVFPANSLTKVVHEYRPDVGGGIPMFIWEEEPKLRTEADWGPGERDTGEFSWLFGCVDVDDYNSAILAWRETEFDGSPSSNETNFWALSQNWLNYVLVTGANWSGPIGRFRLEISTEDKKIVNSCFPGLQRVSDTSLVFEASDFTPTENLSVMFHSMNRW